MRRILPAILRQLQLVLQLAFRPDFDSSIYLDRTRLNIATASLLLLDAFYALMLLYVVKGSAHSAHLLLIVTICTAMACLNLQWRFVPVISPLAVVIFCLWLNSLC